MSQQGLLVMFAAIAAKLPQPISALQRPKNRQMHGGDGEQAYRQLTANDERHTNQARERGVASCAPCDENSHAAEQACQRKPGEAWRPVWAHDGKRSSDERGEP